MNKKIKFLTPSTNKTNAANLWQFWHWCRWSLFHIFRWNPIKMEPDLNQPFGERKILLKPVFNLGTATLDTSKYWKRWLVGTSMVPTCHVQEYHQISESALNLIFFVSNNTSKTDAAPWCYRWTGLDGMDRPLKKILFLALHVYFDSVGKELFTFWSNRKITFIVFTQPNATRVTLKLHIWLVALL